MSQRIFSFYTESILRDWALIYSGCDLEWGGGLINFKIYLLALKVSNGALVLCGREKTDVSVLANWYLHLLDALTRIIVYKNVDGDRLTVVVFLKIPPKQRCTYRGIKKFRHTPVTKFSQHLWSNNPKHHHHYCVASRERNPKMTAPSILYWGSVGPFPIYVKRHLLIRQFCF